MLAISKAVARPIAFKSSFCIHPIRRLNTTLKNPTPDLPGFERQQTQSPQAQNGETQPIVPQQLRKRIVVGITGATGVAIGVRVLEHLKEAGVETHLIVSKWGHATMKYETDYTLNDLTALAHKTYSSRDVSAAISSGLFHTDGMIVVPCSMKTLSAIRIGFTEDLIVRAADVTLKERRKLLLVTRETPLSDIHLENMLKLSQMGTVIFPPVPAFYTRPQSVGDIIEQSAGRILDCFGIHVGTFPRWTGMPQK